MDKGCDSIKLPLKLKIKAWWKGYDLDDIKQKLESCHIDPIAAGERDSEEDDPSSLPWDQLRMQMTQLMWGDGYCGPGGREHIATMCKLLTMNSKMSAIIIGAGLGGPARVLTEEFGVWITAYELSQDLAQQGMQMSIDAGLGAKAIIRPLDPEQTDPFDRLFDRAFSKEALYSFPDKEKILRDVYGTLKEGALFLITDYTLTSLESLQNKDVQRWLKQEATPPYPVTASHIQTILEKIGFTLRVNEDISQEYIELIDHSWGQAGKIAKQLATKGPEGKEAVVSLMREAEFWALRAKLLREGHIHVWRFLAHKPNEPIR